MDITIRIRRDEDGSTNEVQATVTRGGNSFNVHPHEAFSVGEGDVLILDEASLKAALNE